MTRLLYCGCSSACFELDADTPYYSSEPYTVLLNGKEQYQHNANVFSLFNLDSDTKYTVTIVFASGKTEHLTVHTTPDNCRVSVREFGAVGDGVHDDTPCIQAAINLIPRGGRLYFPPGTYLTYPLSLKSYITLELAKGATILGNPNREHYPVIPPVCVDSVTGKETPMASFEGVEQPMYQSLIHGSYVRDVSIVGQGCIDGNGGAGDWWTHFKEWSVMRPRAIFLNRCSNIVLHGITVANSASWNIHPFYSRDLSILDIHVKAPKDSPNTDAIDPESCDGVDIIGCRFSVGDDCIAVKSGKIDMARKYRTPARRHNIRNCLMQFGHGAVTLGSELAAGIRDLHVSQCYFQATDRGLRIKSRRGRGKDSVVTDVSFDNIRMDGVLTPIVINLWYNCCDPDRYTEYVWSREKLPVDDRTPRTGSFTFRNMECTGAQVAACYIDGLPESPIEKVRLENISVSFAEDAQPGKPAMQNFAEDRCKLGFYLDNVRDVEVRNCSISGVEGEPLITDHVESVSVEGLEVH